MKSKCLALISVLLAVAASAVSLNDQYFSPRVVSLNVTKSMRPRSPLTSRQPLRKRQKVVTETLDNDIASYLAGVTVGTPPQQMQLHIDTGSSDMWVNVPTSSLCQTSGCQGGTYDSSASSTYHLVNNQFNISYLDGSTASGDYVSDTLQIGGQTLSSFQFGLGLNSNFNEGVLGVGYQALEVQVNKDGQAPYPNLPAAMVNAGLINSNAYSLWLNDLSANTGTIIFGGVDTAKYSGTLVTVPIIPIGGQYLEFMVAMTGMNIAGAGISSSSSFPMGVLLDSGSSLIYLPSEVATSIYNVVHVVYDTNQDTPYVDCGLQNQSSAIEFVFSGLTISVPYNELVISPASNSDGQPIIFSNGAPACIFGIFPTSGAEGLLGDTFLRSAYVVYDLDNNQISLAQTDFNGATENIQEITKDGVPGAAIVADPATTVVAGGVAGATAPVPIAPTSFSNSGVMGKEVLGAFAVIPVVVAALLMP